MARRVRRCRTAKLRLRGADGYDEAMALDRHLADRFGGETDVVLALADADPVLAEPLVPGLPYRKAEALYAVRHEMARNLDDILSRRTRARLLARDATAAAADEVADLVGAELGWSPAERAAQVAGVPRRRSSTSGRPPTCPRPHSNAVALP